MKAKKILIFSEIKYSFLRQRHQNVADYFVNAGYEVMFVERIPSRIPTLRDLVRVFFLRKKKVDVRITNIQRMPANLHLIPSCFLPDISIFRLYNFVVSILLFFTYRPSLIYTFMNHYSILRLASLLRIPSIFDVVHNYMEMPNNKAGHRKNFPKCLKVATHVVTDSPKMRDKIEDLKVKPANLLYSGYEELIDQMYPNHLNASDGTQLVFFGQLRDNSDIDLMIFLSNIFREKLVIYGEINVSDSTVQNKLLEHYCGSLGAFELFSLREHWMATILPYDASGLSSSIAPAKYFQCMRLQLPIITRKDFSYLPMNNRSMLIDLENDTESSIVEGISRIEKTYDASFVEEANRYRFDKLFAAYIKSVW